MAFWKTSFRQQAVCKALQPKKLYQTSQLLSLTHGALALRPESGCWQLKTPQVHAFMFFWKSFSEQCVCVCESTLSYTCHGQVGAKDWSKEMAP